MSSNPTEPAPMTDKETYAMSKVAEWWRDVCAHKDLDPPPDDFRACLEAAFAFMTESQARGQMPHAPTRIQ